MDEAQRVPIDLSAQPAPDEGQAGRLSQRADGSWVIDILAPQPCGVAVPGEIVVCAPAVDAVRYPKEIERPPEPTLSDQLTEALTTRIGPVEVRPIPGAMQMRVRF